MPRNLTPAEKAQQTRVKKATNTTFDALVDLAADTEKSAVDKYTAVVAMFAIPRLTPSDRYTVFQTIDDGRYGSGPAHSLLRQVRNHSFHGRNLFASINNRPLMTWDEYNAERAAPSLRALNARAIDVLHPDGI